MTQRKLPSYPLFVKDPNFSLWSPTDELNAAHPKTWWGETKPAYGFVTTEEGVFCFLGNYDEIAPLGVKKAEQIDLNVTSFTTDYKFKIGKGVLKVSFVSPLLPTDTDMMSMPVCYMNYRAAGVEKAEISLFLNRRVCYNEQFSQNKGVRGGVAALDGFEAAFFGLKRQQYLSNNDDVIGADWGYFHLAAKEAFYTDDCGLAAYVSSGNKNFTSAGENAWLCAIEEAKFDGVCEKCGKNVAKGRIAIAYDDVVAIDYFGSFKKTAYLEKRTIFEAIGNALTSANEIDERLAAFDADLKCKAEKISTEYYEILTASLRQSIAAHKIVRDDEGNLLFLSKENNSNGCIATVDVSYPSIPLYLIYNTELVKGMMRPILKFSRMPVWKYDFAPHDVGTYPACCGQVYALKNNGDKYHAKYMKDYRFDGISTHYHVCQLPANFEPYDFRYQMPVEESANLLIMFATCYQKDGDIRFFADNADLCEKWVEYLVKYGLKPEDQLCTDDFAGHLKNNLNLAIKATVGIGAYALLLRATKQEKTAEKYEAIAKKYAEEITAFATSFPHSPLTWESDEKTFALKYNLAFDKLLRLGLFPQSLAESETTYYAERCNLYGVPLDSRAEYTKSDWICWAAALTDDKAKAAKIVAPIAEFLHSSPDRTPFSDWYDTKNGTHHWFTARSVQGGCFILLMNENLQ